MPKNEQYEQRIQALGFAELIQLWERIEACDTPDWPDGRAFEYLILRAFQLEGAGVQWPFDVRVDDDSGQVLEQIDGVVFSDGLTCLVEAKDRANALNIEPIAKLRNQLLRRHSSVIGVVFSRSGFTQPAITLARFLAPQTVLLWQGTDIDLALRNRGMTDGLCEKYRRWITHVTPEYSLLAKG